MKRPHINVGETGCDSMLSIRQYVVSIMVILRKTNDHNSAVMYYTYKIILNADLK